MLNNIQKRYENVYFYSNAWPFQLNFRYLQTKVLLWDFIQTLLKRIELKVMII